MNSTNFLILSVTILVCWVGCYEAGPLPHPKHEMEVGNQCRDLCSHCGCTGFYCGDECICDCNQHKIDAKCVGAMHSNCQKLKLPFEVLIQGPSGNQFVHKQGTEKETTMPVEQPLVIRVQRSTAVPASGSTNEAKVPAKIPVNSVSKPNQSVIASLAKKDVETPAAAATVQPKTESVPSAAASAGSAIVSVTDGTASASKPMVSRNKRGDSPVSDVAEVVADDVPAARDDGDDGDDGEQVAENPTKNAPSAVDGADGTPAPKEDGEPQVGASLGLPLLPLAPFKIGKLPLIGAGIPGLKTKIDLAIIKAEAAKNIAAAKFGVQKSLAATKFAALGGPLAAAKAKIAAFKAAAILPVLPKII